MGVLNLIIIMLIINDKKISSSKVFANTKVPLSNGHRSGPVVIQLYIIYWFFDIFITRTYIPCMHTLKYMT